MTEPKKPESLGEYMALSDEEKMALMNKEKCPDLLEAVERLHFRLRGKDWDDLTAAIAAEKERREAVKELVAATEALHKEALEIGEDACPGDCKTVKALARLRALGYE